MAGVKGKSGRKGCYYELDVKQLLNKSYLIMMSFLDDPKIPIERKAPFTAAFLQKKIGDRISLQVDHVFTIPQLDKLKEKILEYSAHDFKPLELESLPLAADPIQ